MRHGEQTVEASMRYDRGRGRIGGPLKKGEKGRVVAIYEAGRQLLKRR